MDSIYNLLLIAELILQEIEQEIDELQRCFDLPDKEGVE